MNPFRDPLTAFFLILYCHLFFPSHPGRQVVGIDFGEPTRNCAGRGQICRIDRIGTPREGHPESPGEVWMDSSGVFHLSIWELWWDEETDSTRQWLFIQEPVFIPDEHIRIDQGSFEGMRSDGKIIFPLGIPKQ